MEYCHYTLNLGGVTKYATSYSDLFNLIEKYIDNGGDIDLANISDIVFSKNSKQKSIKEKIQNNIIENLDMSKSNSIVDGEPGIKGRLEILQFLDSDKCNIEGNRLVTPYDSSQYETFAISDLQKQGYSEQDATNMVKQEIASWDYLSEDAKYLHELADSNLFHIKDDAEYLEKVKDRLPDSYRNVAVSLKDQLSDAWKMAKGANPNQESFKSLYLNAKLKGFDEKIFGHVDWLFVGEDGTIHLYVIKASTQNSKDWISVKRNKYKYQLAFLEQMLRYNGIPTKNIELNILPVKFTYDDKGNIRKASVQNVEHYSSLSNSPEYAMHKYRKAVSYFIEDNSSPFHISSEPLNRAMTVNRAIFPTVNLKNDGLGESAKEWIKWAPSENINGVEPLVIKKVQAKDHAYEVIINGITHNIKSGKDRNTNTEILNLVTEHLQNLEDSKGYSTQRLKEAINNSFDKGFMTFSSTNGLKGNSIQYESVLGKYLNDYEEDPKTGDKKYKWKLLDDLIDANVLIFENQENHTIDVITLSTFDPNVKAITRRGQTFILWNYLRDSDPESINMVADYGNIEAVRTMELLNEIFPKLGDNIKLGSIGVLSSVGKGSFRSFNINEFNKNYFSKIIKIVNRENPDLKIHNNFKDANFVNIIEELTKEFISIVQGKPSTYTKDYDQLGFQDLKVNDTSLAQMHALENILLKIQASGYANFADPRNLEQVLAQPSESKSKNIARLYELTTKAYLQLRGETPTTTTELNKINANFMTAATVDSDNIKIVVNNLQTTHDAIAEEFLNEYQHNIPKIFDTFYKECGYSQTQNMLIGNQASQYSNVFDRDDDMFSFKNPYDMSNDLKPHERKMLKQVLYNLDKINRNGNSQFSSIEDSKIPEYIKAHPEYLWVPLERASDATKRQSKEAIVAGMKNFMRTVQNAANAFDEFAQGITPEERELYGQDSESFYRMHLKNPFSLSIPSSSASANDVRINRRRMLDKYGKAFFETNVENIFVDFLAKHISTTQYNKLLVASKALMLELHLTGNYNGNRDIVEKEIKWMQDYLKVNVFNTSVMSPTEKKIVGLISPVKKVVTHMLLGGNIVGALRDSLEGAQQNFVRSVIKLNTDITPKEVRDAYAYVFTHSTNNAMAQNLLSQLCLKYRISNTDVGRIAERAKTGRTGILNMENIMYSTLRCPDFLNRMTLFVAKCMHDGVWEAFSLDKDGNLKYDWTKDKRFFALKTAPENSEAYKKALSAYYSAIREYNEEHPDNPIEKPDNDWPSLPEPYSRRMVNSIRGLGDNIYGSYDKGKKAMAEHASYGFLFGTFSTWMNGIVNNYFMGPQKNGVSQLKQEQEVDDQGNKLFFTKDFQITTEDTGMPVLKNVPIMIQGIIPTIGELYNLVQDKGWKTTFEYIKGNSMVKSNIYKLTSDALLWALMAGLFGFILGPAYTEHKKNAHKDPLLTNMLTELVYKASSRSYSQYAGPVNVIQFFGENMNPPYYTAPVQVITDAWKGLIGDKSFKYLMFDNSGLTRSFKDSAFAYIKAQS